MIFDWQRGFYRPAKINWDHSYKGTKLRYAIACVVGQVVFVTITILLAAFARARGWISEQIELYIDIFIIGNAFGAGITLMLTTEPRINQEMEDPDRTQANK